MSMLSMQVDELRELAGDGGMEWVTGPIRASVLRDAADTIWSMRERLRAAYAEIQELEKRVRELDELLPENGRWYSAEVTEAYVDENSKLRELVRFIMHQCNEGNPRCDECIGWNDGECVALQRMQELGIGDEP